MAFGATGIDKSAHKILAELTETVSVPKQRPH